MAVVTLPPGKYAIGVEETALTQRLSIFYLGKGDKPSSLLERRHLRGVYDFKKGTLISPDPAQFDRDLTLLLDTYVPLVQGCDEL